MPIQLAILINLPNLDAERANIRTPIGLPSRAQTSPIPFPRARSKFRSSSPASTSCFAISSSSFSSPLSPSGPGRHAPVRRCDQLAIAPSSPARCAPVRRRDQLLTIAPSGHDGRSAPAHRRYDQLLGTAIISGLSGQLLVAAVSR